MKDAPIGILDSGLGGLTVWREIRRELPGESIIYIGDHAYQPYSQRSTQSIRRRVKAIIGFLLRKSAKLIVIACNTATVAGIDHYRVSFPHVPIIGVVPVVKKAVEITKSKHFAVLSTPYTAASRYQKRLIQTFANSCRVDNIGVPELAPLIEAGETDGKVSVLLRRYLKNLGDVDVIALGCTHYPFIRQRIEEIAGKSVAVIDSGGAVARHAGRILMHEHLRARHTKPYTEWYTTGNAVKVSGVASQLMHEWVRFKYERI